MKRIIGTMLAAALAAGPGGTAAAEGGWDGRPTLAVPGVIWKGDFKGSARLADATLDESRTPGTVTVITADEIRQSGMRTVQEVLSSQSAIIQYDTVGNSFQQTVDMRGFNASPVPATAVIVDGVRVNEANFGQINFQLIPIEDIERIEIHPGPSTRFGKNALAGVIHITTKRAAKGEGVSAEAGASYGSYNRRKGFANARGTVGDVDYRVSGVKEHDGGYRENANAAISNMQVKVGYRKDELTDTVVSYQRADDRFQQPGALTDAEWQADPQSHVSAVDTLSKLDFFRAEHKMALPMGITAAVNGYVRERRETTPKNQGRTSATQSLAHNKSRGAAIQGSRESEVFGRKMVTRIGTEFNALEADSATSGSFTSNTVVKEKAMGVFIENVVDLVPERLAFTAGLRYDESRISNEDRITANKSGETAFHHTSPRVGLNYNHNDDIGVYIAYSQSFRTPTMSELSALGSANTGLLKPVRAKNVELGGRWRIGKNAEFKTAAYHTTVRDEIFFDPTGGGAFGQNINVDRTRRIGVETSARGRLGKWEGFLNHAFTDASFKTGLFMSKAPFTSNQRVDSGDRIPMVPEHRVRMGVAFRPAEGVRILLEEFCTGSQRIFGDEGNTEPTLAGYCDTNLGVTYDREDWGMFVKGFNIFDNQHATHGILSTNGGVKTRFIRGAPGITVQGGVTYRFGAGDGGALARKAPMDVLEVARRAVRR